MLTNRFARSVRATLISCALGGAVLVAGCGKQPPAFTNLDITGNKQFGSDFSLPDTSGKIRTMADYKGKVVVLFFGYTHCPDVCPTTMAELSQALQQLGPDDAKRVRVLFVTVDPERDTPALLAQYVPAFNPTFVGLRSADQVQLAKVTKDFRVYYAKVPGKTPDSYTMDHTAASYVFDPDGKLRFFARDGQGATPWVHDIKLLLN
ncbi:MAG: Cytochrome oxidase biogenesis protein Sco1/SenC/PrrC, thiol-disulfide reductase involved in Cu(I) insertion into CoxII Cu(A) center [uncultured Paraburkholderia sp.]|nr:MAG: Cytochrome oxidase biogenesis protein Sco1/SenC/PrrC, thiol-disulfide reductase involved in Cu(I) insertion into CoxII Cu(A) center [uncultured Paraburkholderia sp.]CAH2929543.1 MAG: Cytochrome oxidase biogenesis protein Sco1/SenC/PrrC, thiol-disulfide reductase involved in Cu(I) insertion into CoxII Cu(A) center [uncultured Paraburkholderia sp.]